MTEEKKENEKIDDMDRMTLEVAKQRRLAAIASAEVADLAHKNLVMQLFLKYGLTAQDTIREDSGEIVRNGETASPSAPAAPKDN